MQGMLRPRRLSLSAPRLDPQLSLSIPSQAPSSTTMRIRQQHKYWNTHPHSAPIPPCIYSQFFEIAHEPTGHSRCTPQNSPRGIPRCERPVSASGWTSFLVTDAGIVTSNMRVQLLFSPPTLACLRRQPVANPDTMAVDKLTARRRWLPRGSCSNKKTPNRNLRKQIQMHVMVHCWIKKTKVVANTNRDTQHRSA